MRRRTMPLVGQRVPDDGGCSLVASLDNVRNLSTVLKAIHFRDHATCFATKNGIKVTVENAKCVQANAFIQVGRGTAPSRCRGYAAPSSMNPEALAGVIYAGKQQRVCLAFLFVSLGYKSFPPCFTEIMVKTNNVQDLLRVQALL